MGKSKKQGCAENDQPVETCRGSGRAAGRSSLFRQSIRSSVSKQATRRSFPGAVRPSDRLFRRPHRVRDEYSGRDDRFQDGSHADLPQSNHVSAAPPPIHRPTNGSLIESTRRANFGKGITSYDHQFEGSHRSYNQHAFTLTLQIIIPHFTISTKYSSQPVSLQLISKLTLQIQI